MTMSVLIIRPVVSADKADETVKELKLLNPAERSAKPAVARSRSRRRMALTGEAVIPVWCPLQILTMANITPAMPP